MTGLAHILYAVIDLLKAAIEIVNQAEQLHGDEVMKWVDKCDVAHTKIRELEIKLANSGNTLAQPSKDTMDDLIRNYLARNPEKYINAIKYVRVMTNWGLREAKEYVDERK